MHVMSCHCQSAIEHSHESPDLAGMIATLGSYDRLFGPYHLQTLSLAARIAEALSGSGDTQSARRLLQRVVRDFSRSAGRTHATRIAALNGLRDILLRESDVEEAIGVQTEIAECWLLLAGPEAPETAAARSALGTLLLLHSQSTVEN